MEFRNDIHAGKLPPQLPIRKGEICIIPPKAGMRYHDIMSLTVAQKAKIKKILTTYQRNVRNVVKQHKQAVTSTVEEHDKQKAEGIRKLIG